MDDCSDKCTTVCDGFVDCDKSTICSESYCHNSQCQNPTTACFDEHCMGSHYGDVQHGLENTFLNQDGSINWDCTSLNPEHLNCGFHGQNLETSFPSHTHSMGAPATPSSELPGSVKSLGHGHYYSQQPFGPRTHMVPGSCLTHGLGSICIGSAQELCNSADDCTYQQKLDNGLTLENCSGMSAPFASLQTSRVLHHRYQHGSLQALASQLCRQHEAARTVTTSTRTTPSLSIQSSPVPTSSHQEMSSASAFASPDFMGTDGLHICRWVGNKLENTICGAIFPDAGSLQKHLTVAHADPSQGCQGQGYYCCWEGCSRPDEPFSQKSKLQGHFLTHSNYKSFRCSICGKPFARQATLERHERSHRGDKPYKCKECGKQFTDSSELSEKPFKCNHPGCNFETGDHMVNENTNVLILDVQKALLDQVYFRRT
ncbi:hypothetical protein UREG_03440 [Uncinocarpus reesii 1704]|uniref:C2H2-type domain-containing protein n=1 Tax=Uncinocarpus reesii (strain UAMH 1704) TaxID=336963 RepID=C4JQV8_UNCRE|nr:uncharacterized protein UREG_03440 [Uncinocarpus reesii 1704]EEP78594.1 hypothetical protein UREG_03440 [Uncinocarpus reesii 1704]